MHVVVIDDAPELIMLFRLLLEREPDLQVTTIGADFKRITEHVDWQSVDVAVVDRFLEDDVDGAMVLSWLANTCPSVRRIMLTGDYDIDARQANAHVVLRKPVTNEQLIKAVRDE